MTIAFMTCLLLCEKADPPSPPALFRRGIGRREAVARNAPLSLVALLEDEELLVCFRSGLACRMMVRRPRRIRADIGPSRRHHDQFRDIELHVEFQLAEDGVVGLF